MTEPKGVTLELVAAFCEGKAAEVKAAIKRMDSGEHDNGVMRVLRLEALDDYQKMVILVRAAERVVAAAREINDYAAANMRIPWKSYVELNSALAAYDRAGEKGEVE